MTILAPGARIGRYRLIAHLATGGMAEVWSATRAEPQDDGVELVLKVMLPALAQHREFIAMFEREAELAKAVAHPNVVRVFEHGESRGWRFLVMERVRGRTLRELGDACRRRGKVIPDWLACHVACETCVALDHTHGAVDADGRALRVVHRDLTPENVMVSYSGATQLLDFGLARAARTVSSLRPGVVAGKYAYLAPEQISGSLGGEPGDHRADVYSLGVVLYELLSGRTPFVAENDVLLLRAILDGPPPPPLRDLVPWLPRSLEAIVERALARDLSARFQDAAELLAALEAHLAAVGQYPTRRHVARFLERLFPEASPQTDSSPPSSLSAGGARATVEAVAAFEVALDHLRARDPERARAALERAAALDPGNRTYRSNLDVLLRRASEPRVPRTGGREGI